MSNLKIDDWLLAESFRRAEERLGRRPDDKAVAIARASGRDFAGRLAARASALPEAAAARADIQRLVSGLGWLTLGLAVLGLVSGLVAGRIVAADRQVEILLAVAVLLLVPTLMLIVWMIAWLLVSMQPRPRRRASGGAVGRLAAGLLRRLAPRLLSSTLATDVMAAFASALLTPWGRWRLSLLTHVFWLAYAAGVLIILALLFSVAQYDLYWGTTLLADSTVVCLAEILVWWPQLLGFFPAIDPGWIAVGREAATDAALRTRWAEYLLAVIAAWAVVPRAFFTLWSALAARFSARRVVLDTGRPGYLRLSVDLAPLPQPASEPGVALPAAVERPRRRKKPGASGLLAVAVELNNEKADARGLLPGLKVSDLGRADSRRQRSAVLQAVGARRRPAEALIGVCSMLRTPDAGTERFLVRLSEAADAPLWLVLDEEHRLAERGADIGPRRHDWQALARRAGAGIVFIDREQPDAAELARLQRGLHNAEAAS